MVEDCATGILELITNRKNERKIEVHCLKLVLPCFCNLLNQCFLLRQMRVASLSSIQISFELSVDAKIVLSSQGDSMRNNDWQQLTVFKMLRELQWKRLHKRDNC